MTLEQARRDPFYWTMLLTFLLIGIGLQSVMLHLVPMLRSRGVDPMLAATAQSTLFFGLVIGRLITGWLMDRFFAPRVALAFLIAPIIGIAVLALGGSGWTAFAAAALVGLAAGAEVDVIAFLTSRYFGLMQYSRIYGTYYAVYSLGGGLGPLLTAQALERTGGYAPILWVHISLLAIAALLLSRFRSFPSWPRGQE
jgi:MFS family permease